MRASANRFILVRDFQSSFWIDWLCMCYGSALANYYQIIQTQLCMSSPAPLDEIESMREIWVCCEARAFGKFVGANDEEKLVSRQ